MGTKMVVLFLVEGIWDERALAGILEDLTSANETLSFQIIGTDITSDEKSCKENIEELLIEQIEGKCSKEGFWHSDIALVVQLMDMDGACIADEDIVEMMVDKAQYQENCIQTRFVEKMQERNRRKRALIQYLCQLDCLKNRYGEQYRYQTYYFSCNLEHVLHNIRNAPDFQKGELAERFAEQFYNNPQQFVDFLRQDSIRVDGDYKETWEFIQQGRNTLHRHCNFHLYFE